MTTKKKNNINSKNTKRSPKPKSSKKVKTLKYGGTLTRISDVYKGDKKIRTIRGRTMPLRLKSISRNNFNK